MINPPFRIGAGRPTPEHPDPKKRRARENQHYGTVDKFGEYHGPKGGMIPDAPSGEPDFPGRKREEQHARRFGSNSFKRRGY